MMPAHERALRAVSPAEFSGVVSFSPERRRAVQAAPRVPGTTLFARKAEPPGAEVIEEFLAAGERRGLRPSYIKALRSTLRRIAREIGVGLDVVSAEELEAWEASIPANTSTRLGYLNHLSSFYNWAVRQRIRVDDPTVRVDRPRQKHGIPRPISDDDLRRALATAGLPVRGFLVFAAFEGLRACEIATVHREDLLDGQGILIIREGKGGKQRALPIHQEVVELLEFLPTTGPLFVSRNGGEYTPNTISQRANRHLHELGIPLSLHSLRHWFATQIYRQSSDLRLTQELLGHSSPSTTARYTQLAPEKAARVMGMLTMPLKST